MNKIDSIRITDNLKTKTIKLFQNFTVPNEITLGQAQNFNGLHFLGTNYLDSIRIGDDKHCFIYRDKYCFGNHQRGHDAWGHVNNQTKELSSYNIAHPLLTTPRQRKKIKHKMANVTKPFEFGGQCKLVEQPNEQLMQKGILKRIVYPTGGFVDFDFEANKYEETYNKSYIGKDNLVMRNGGGLRIRSINYYSGDSYQASLQKYYRYGNYEEGSGLMADAPEVTMNGNNWDWRWDYKGFDYTQIINYSYVTNQGELSTLLPPVQDSLTVYLPASALDYTYANGAPVYYTKVTEYQQDMGVQTGKTVYKYYPPDKFYSDPLYFKKKMIDGTNIPHIKVDWHLGALESVAQYKYMEGKFQLYHLKKMEYDHTKFRKNQTPRVVFSFPHTIRQPILNAYTDQAYKLYDCMTGEYGLPVGRLLISKETEKWFESAGDSIVQTTNYCYDNNTYIQPTKIEKTNSTGSQIITLKYPYDETGTVYTEMVSKKIFNPVIQETITIQDNATNLEISKIRVNYRKTPTGYFVRDKIESSVQGQPLTEELRFDSYDNNINVTQTTHRNLAVKSYLWGYTGRYLVAEIENATFASASALLTPTGVGVLDNPTTAESDKIIELEKLDQLPNAMVNAYTWRLFAGVETHISPQKTKTTYDYDLSGRLKTIKDHDKNVVQSFEYKTLKSSLISNEMFYTNMPRMDTDEMICGTGLLGINNRFYLGGQEKIFYQPNYSIEAFPQWGLIENDTYNTCAAASGFVKITLRSILLDSPSRYVVFDFYKDGAIFASKTFYCYSSYQNQPSNPKDIYLPVGEYNVVLRTGAQSYDDVHLVLQYDDTTGIYKYITYNDKVNFQSGLLYTFWVMDAY
jgi:YD repeat-containing protein